MHPKHLFRLFVCPINGNIFYAPIIQRYAHMPCAITNGKSLFEHNQITSLTIDYSNVYSDADKIIHQSSTSLAFVWGIHRGPVDFPHKWSVTRKMFPCDDVMHIRFHGLRRSHYQTGEAISTFMRETNFVINISLKCLTVWFYWVTDIKSPTIAL